MPLVDRRATQPKPATSSTDSYRDRELRVDRPSFTTCWNRSIQAPLETDAVDEQLQHADRVLAQMRIMLADAAPSDRAVPNEPEGSRKRRRRDPAASRRPAERRGGFHALLGAIGWMSVYAGTTATMCGAVLVAMGLLDGRATLTQLGWPIAMVGQIGLMFGLTVLLIRAVRDNRRARRRRVSGPHRRNNANRARRGGVPGE